MWQAVESPKQSYTVFVHVVDGDGNTVAQQDSPPGLGKLPTSGWVAGEVVDDHHPIMLPADMPAGRYRLVVGLYDPITDIRLPARGDLPGVAPDSVALTEFNVP